MRRRHHETTDGVRVYGATGTKRERLRQRRRTLTPAERVLWSALRGHQLGAKFRNGHLVAGLLVDFYAASLRVAVEVDGVVHDAQVAYDDERTRVLHAHGVRVVRVTNNEVLGDLPRALARIADVLRAAQAERSRVT